jgi:hypothetical protein
MRPYGFNKKEYGEDSKKAGGWYNPTHHTVGIANVLRVYKKTARQEAKKAVAKGVE